VTQEYSDVRVEVDSFLSAEKRIVGPPAWSETDLAGQFISKRSLVADGFYSGGNLQMIAYPNTARREFRILIDYAGFCVARLDWVYEVDPPHINDFNRPLHYPSIPLREPHFHPWEGNHQLGAADRLPKKLLYARQINSRIDNMKQGFWWFCETHNISATNQNVPEWPSSSRLL
jgi:hypothetical protein